ncbi:MAG: hypothetical protein QME90_16215 [Thermodesulfobacteriota bacterium]|nr:hypothetical protein [Thermodesulfobacteriota bacterium]
MSFELIQHLKLRIQNFPRMSRLNKGIGKGIGFRLELLIFDYKEARKPGEADAPADLQTR